MKTLYLCRGCTTLIPEFLFGPDTQCPNCHHTGPHIPGQFDPADAHILIEGGEQVEPKP